MLRLITVMVIAISLAVLAVDNVGASETTTRKTTRASTQPRPPRPSTTPSNHPSCSAEAQMRMSTPKLSCHLPSNVPVLLKTRISQIHH